MFGHTALNIDGKVYSYEGDGKLHVRDYADFVKGETENVAPIIEQTLEVDQSKVENRLQELKADPGSYDRNTNSCANLTMDALAAGGIEFNKPNGSVTPLMLSNGLEGSKHVTRTARLGSGMTVSSIGGHILRGVALILLDLNLSPKDKLSTAPILKK